MVQQARWGFQSTLPMRGATQAQRQVQAWKEISIHTPHAGSDTGITKPQTQRGDFNPHSPCGERRIRGDAGIPLLYISIHTPHAGSDISGTDRSPKNRISIHTPHAGSDTAADGICRTANRFQSTLPMRGATPPGRRWSGFLRNFNPHSPCGERRDRPIKFERCISYFNPHSPCGERHVGSESAG